MNMVATTILRPTVGKLTKKTLGTILKIAVQNTYLL
ncbi:MAG: hypothetical protein RBG13Loki_3718 [Promethearchaeota archaeon CR_4]|nr:MAG: hypothetical protein RBG13Loki_3718 [Candidatus Lokiarchaeota archaeon CR_4]